MKKSLLLSVSLFASVTAFVGQAAQSGNTFGVQRVDSKSAQTIVCIPWIDPSAGGEIAVADIVKTANLTAAGESYLGDELRWYNPATKGFVVWRLNKERTWSKAKNAFEPDEADPDPDNVTTLKRGQAIGIVRKNPTDSSGNAIPFYVHGQVPASGAVEVEFPAGSKEAPVYTLFAPPMASVSPGVDVNSATWTNIDKETGKSDGDQLIVTVEKSGKLVQETLYYSADEKKWGAFNLTKQDVIDGKTAPSWKESINTHIAPGCGAWFVSRGETDGKKVTWNVQ